MTAVFVGYLHQVAPEHATSIEPDGGRAKRPGTVIGAEGSSKLVARVKSVAGGSGYVSSHFTLRESLTAIALQNKQGEYVEPSLGTFKAVIIAGGLFKNGLEPTPLLNLDGVGSLAHRHRHLCVGAPRPKSLQRASRTLNFFHLSFLMGDRAVAGTRFAPLPTATQARIVALLTSFKTSTVDQFRSWEP